MSISSINNLTPTILVASPTRKPPTPASEPGDNHHFSAIAQGFSELHSLSKSDPAKFEAVTAQISTQLQTAAQNATGYAQQFLTKLSDRFQAASQSGKFSDLFPPKPAITPAANPPPPVNTNPVPVNTNPVSALSNAHQATSAQELQGILQQIFSGIQAEA